MGHSLVVQDYHPQASSPLVDVTLTLLNPTGGSKGSFDFIIGQN